MNSKGVDGRIKSGHDGVLWLPERWIATAAFSRLAMTVLGDGCWPRRFEMRKGLVLVGYVNINALEEDSRFRENDGVNSKGVDGRTSPAMTGSVAAGKMDCHGGFQPPRNDGFRGWLLAAAV